MSNEYEVSVVWPADEAQKMPPDKAYSRDNWLEAPGKAEVFGSAPVAFGGDPKGYNPEELVLLSLTQCHLLTYLAMAAKRQIKVLHYEDHSVATLGKGASGKTQMIDALLRPRVTVAKGTNLDDAEALHAAAHANCFIANSVNFPVRHDPLIFEK